MNVIFLDQEQAYQQLSYSIECPVCGEPMEARKINSKWYLDCTSCMAVFGGAAGSSAGGYDTAEAVIEAYTQARKNKSDKPNEKQESRSKGE